MQKMQKRNSAFVCIEGSAAPSHDRMHAPCLAKLRNDERTAARLCAACASCGMLRGCTKGTSEIMRESCPICESETKVVPRPPRAGADAAFVLRHCPKCRFSFIQNPCRDFARIYSRDYYLGRGADPLVDYVGEQEHPDTTARNYEWQGISTLVASLVPLGPKTRWFDLGCGNGMLLAHVRSRIGCHIAGSEDGWIRDHAIAKGIPLLDAEGMKQQAHSFDVVTAIEVFEHLIDPLETLRLVRSLLKPRGLFFFTTGNARLFRGRLHTWSYFVPEIHVSYFEPQTMELALRKTGFRPEFLPFRPGMSDVIRFKTLKNLRIRNRGGLESLAPWDTFARLVKWRGIVFEFPVGWAQ